MVGSASRRRPAGKGVVPAGCYVAEGVERVEEVPREPIPPRQPFLLPCGGGLLCARDLSFSRAEPHHLSESTRHERRQGRPCLLASYEGVDEKRMRREPPPGPGRLQSLPSPPPSGAGVGRGTGLAEERAAADAAGPRAPPPLPPQAGTESNVLKMPAAARQPPPSHGPARAARGLGRGLAPQSRRTPVTVPGLRQGRPYSTVTRGTGTSLLGLGRRQAIARGGGAPRSPGV